ncbi:hypothetical protein PC123_g26290 [Phytophthora cactorum]|nr:hypothetical protein PC123_g26290 [Phytophthora cactorum]
MVPYHYPVELLKRAATDLEAQLEYEGEVEREVHAAEAGEAPQAQAAAVQAVTTTKVRGRVGQPNCSHGRKDRCRTVNSRHPNEQLRDFCDASVAGATVAAGWMDETAMSVQGQLLGGPAGAEAGEIECSVENFTNGAQVGASQAENENESARHTISTTRGTKLLRTDVRVRASNENENGVRS